MPPCLLVYDVDHPRQRTSDLLCQCAIFDSLGDGRGGVVQAATYDRQLVFGMDTDCPAKSSATTNLNFKAGLGTPAVGSSTTALVELSDEGKVNVTNTSSAPVDFNVTGQGWVTQYEEPYVIDGTET